MKLSRYEYFTESNAEIYRFIGVGPNGNIKKLVVYSPMLETDVYNLAFGDYDELTDSSNDKAVTNNEDSQKVLATVASTLYVFTDKHPNIWIYATGSTEARTRLYRIGIANNIEAIKPDFQIFGLINEEWQEFEKGKNYQAFLVKRKLL